VRQQEQADFSVIVTSFQQYIITTTTWLGQSKYHFKNEKRVIVQNTKRIFNAALVVPFFDQNENHENNPIKKR